MINEEYGMGHSGWEYGIAKDTQLSSLPAFDCITRSQEQDLMNIATMLFCHHHLNINFEPWLSPYANQERKP